MNRWFSALPSCTDPNKMFLHAATSKGNTGPCVWTFCEGYPIEVETIFERLDSEGVSNKIRYLDWNEAFAITPLNKNVTKFLLDEEFEDLYEKMANH